MESFDQEKFKREWAKQVKFMSGLYTDLKGEEQDFPCGKPENHNNYEQGNCLECGAIKLNI